MKFSQAVYNSSSIRRVFAKQKAALFADEALTIEQALAKRGHAELVSASAKPQILKQVQNDVEATGSCEKRHAELVSASAEKAVMYTTALLC